jgi:protein-export membrane protein SecD
MRNKKVNIIIIIIFVLIIGVSLYYILTNPINLGLDLKGGTQIILKPVETESSEVTSESLDQAMLIIMDRIDRLGISEPLVTRDISNNIVIQLPGVKDPDRAINIIGKTAQLEFRILKGSLIFRKGTDTEFAGFDPETGEIIYDKESDEVILVEGINTDLPLKAGVLYEDASTGMTYLMNKDFDPDNIGKAGEEDSLEEDADKPEGGYPEDALDGSLIEGVFEYDGNTGELLLMDNDTGENIGELLIDSRTGAASLVGPVLLTGNRLARSSAGYDSNGRIIVSLSFKSEGADIFEEVTRNNTGKQLAIVLDEEIKSAPFINVPITGGNAVIEGINNLEEARDISLVLQTGALPVNLLIEESSMVGPTLGRDALQKGIYAGVIGFILIIIFMFVYYRGLGLVSALGLIIYVIIFWGVLAGIGAALTLPGIAGIILTIGMAVDANVIIFARIREESRKGKSNRIAIIDGFRNALSTIIDSNVTTLITAAALYRFGTGPIKGFAVTLALGVVISMVISLLFTRSVLFLASGFSGLSSPGLIGVRKIEEQ